MRCENCDQFNTEVAIRSPSDFRRIAGSIRGAIDAGILRYNSFESSRELVGQSSFMDLDLAGGPLPDVMRYHVNCPVCGNCFGLFVETYHGSGGRWSFLGRVPLHTIR